MRRRTKLKNINPLFFSAIPFVIISLVIIINFSSIGKQVTPDPSPDPSQDQPLDTPSPPITMTPETPSEEDTDGTQDDVGIEDTVISINYTMSEIADFLDYFALKYNAAAVSIAVYDGDWHDYYVYQYGYSDISYHFPVDVDTKFCVASLSKLVAVIVAMTLVDEGRLDLDADISEYLGVTVRNPIFPDTVITTRMIILHVSSIYDSAEYWDKENKHLPETTLELLLSGEAFTPWNPGDALIYSGFLGYSVLGLICEIVSGKRFDELAHSVLFEPLGIDAAFLPSNLIDTTNIAVLYDVDHENYITVDEQLDFEISLTRSSDHDRAAAGLTISALDYAKIMVMLGNGGIYYDARILSEDMVKEIFDYKFASWYQDEIPLPFTGSYFHVGRAWGVKAQYIRYGEEDINRGIIVITTGARDGDFQYSMNDVATELSIVAAQVFG